MLREPHGRGLQVAERGLEGGRDAGRIAGRFRVRDVLADQLEKGANGAAAVARFRYRVDRKLPLPGVNRRADIVFGPARVAVFVDGSGPHGCPVHGNPRIQSNT